MKRSLLVASLCTALCATAALGASQSDAAPRGKPSPSPSPLPTSSAPVALPTATPEPASVAIPRLQNAIKANPNDYQSMTDLAGQFLTIGRPDLAIQLTQNLLQHGQKNAQVYYDDGSAQQTLGNIPAAIADFESASNLEPTNASVLGALTQLYLRANRTSDAERVANRAVTFNKTDPESFINLGIVYANEQKFDDARKQFEQAYTLNPKDVTPLLQEGQTYVDQNAVPNALTVVEKAITVDPKNVQALVFRADLFAREHEDDKSASAFDDAVAAAPDASTKVGILIRKAAMWTGESQNPKAEQVYADLIKAYPNVSTGHTAFGEYWLAQKQVPKAVPEFQAALAIDKDDASALGDLAQIDFSSGKLSDAIPYLKHLTDLNPTAQAYGMLGQAYISTHQYTNAKDACSKAFQLNRTPDTLGCIAGSDYSLKNYKEAAQIFDALNVNVKAFMDQNPQLLYMAGVAYTQTNQKTKAIDAYRRLLRGIQPGTKEYKQLQQAITDLNKPTSPAPKPTKKPAAHQ